MIADCGLLIAYDELWTAREPRTTHSQSAGALRAARTPQSSFYTATASSSGATSHSFPHFRHLRNSPRALVIFASAPSNPHSGHRSATGRFHETKSHAG